MRLAPLIEELAAFWREHVEGDGAVAAERMKSRVRRLWPEISKVSISEEPDSQGDLEMLAVRIVMDIGEAARRLADLDEVEALGWSRANLIIDLERYLVVARRR